MRLLLLTIDFPPQTGGVARYLDALATHFRDEITVVAPTIEGGNDSMLGYRVLRKALFGFGWPKWLPMVRVLSELRESADVVITSHVLPVGTAAMIASWMTKKPYVVIVHGLDIVLAKRSATKRWLAGQVLRRAKLVVTNSKALEGEIKKEFLVEDTLVVYPCVRLSPTEPQSRSLTQPLRLLTVSRLVARKGHVRVIDALARLRQRGQLNNMRYVIVGDGPMCREIENAVRDRGLGDVVTLVTNADDARLTQAYAVADVFVMPTVDIPDDREGFGTVYVEAAAFGVPAIASNLPGVDEAVVDGKTGLLVPDGDVEALADAVYRLASDPGLRSQLGEAARTRALAEFTPEVQFGKLRAALAV